MSGNAFPKAQGQLNPVPTQPGACANLPLNGRHEERYMMTPTGTSWYYETMTHDAYEVVLGLKGLIIEWTCQCF